MAEIASPAMLSMGTVGSRRQGVCCSWYSSSHTAARLEGQGLLVLKGVPVDSLRELSTVYSIEAEDELYRIKDLTGASLIWHDEAHSISKPASHYPTDEARSDAL